MLVCVEWIGVSVCRSAHLTCLGGYFLVHVGMYRFVLHSWHRDLHGYSSVLSVGQVVSSYAGSCFLYFTKVVALFSSSPPNDNSV